MEQHGIHPRRIASDVGKARDRYYRPARHFSILCVLRTYQARFYIFIIEALKANSKYSPQLTYISSLFSAIHQRTISKDTRLNHHSPKSSELHRSITHRFYMICTIPFHTRIKKLAKAAADVFDCCRCFATFSGFTAVDACLLFIHSQKYHECYQPSLRIKDYLIAC